MIIRETNQDLFTVPQGYYLAHCISGDYALETEIAKRFNEVYNMKQKLYKNYEIVNVGKALLVDNVFNLVVKKHHFHKTVYDNLYNALLDMKEWCKIFSVTKLAMPRITPGLNQSDWNKVKNLIENVFNDMDIEILVCVY